ncbi:MAG: hypothetical protein IH612_19530 [Desulfofustis sp.]|nr:hypothetical protein [Desulfofustis sp.]
MRKIFSGMYSWDGKKHDERPPIAWFPGSYYLQICEVRRGAKNITPLKPFVCIYQQAGVGHSISAEPERFVQHICHDFSLAVDRVLWVERSPHPSAGAYQVIVFTKSGRLGDQDLYRVSKRDPTAAEAHVIEQIVPEPADEASSLPLDQQA